MPTQRAPRRSRQQWQAIITEFETSKLSTVDFCKEKGFSYESFVKWRKHLTASEKPKSNFVKLPSTTVDFSPTSGAQIVCQLASGHRLQWDESVSPNYIAKLVEMLR